MFGSNWTLSVADATSVPPSSCTDTASWLFIRVSTCAGENTTRALPAGGVASGLAGSAVRGGAVAGGASGGGVAGGAVAGGFTAGAVTPGVFTADPAAGGWPEGIGVGAAGVNEGETAATAAGPLTTSVGFGA